MRAILVLLLTLHQWPAAAQTARSAVKSYTQLKFKPMKELRLPDIASFTLSNGMKVYLLENHELPLVRGSARIRAGNVLDPADKTGLSDIFGDVMRDGGTKSKTPDQINELLEGIAASVESNIAETSGTLSFSTLAEHTDTVLATFKDILTEPEFRQEKLDVVKSQDRSAIARRNDEPQGIAGNEFERLMYGATTAWGRQMEYETLDRITRQDLIDYHKRYIFPANMILAVQGDFVTAVMRDKLEKLFADWNVKQPPPPAFPPVTNQPKPGIYLAEKPDTTQTFFRIGHLGGMLSDKDYPALDVMTDILGGGGFTSRLLKKVRSDLGLAYNVSANWAANYDHPGTFVIAGSTKSESTVDTIKAIRAEVDRIRTTEVSDEELQVAKDSTLNSFVFNFDSSSKVLSRLVTYEYFGYPKDWIFTYQKAVEAVTKADVLRVAKQYIKPENFVIVTVGKPEDFGTPLSALNLPLSKIDLTIPEPKRETPAADAASMMQGKQLLRGLQKAVGGTEKLAAVKDYSHTAQVTVLGNGLKVTQITKFLPPQARIEQQLSFGKIIIYYDGKGSGFMQGPQGAAPLPPPAVKQAKEELFRLHPTLWMSDRNPERTVNSTGPNVVEISDKQGNWIKLTIDPQTGLPSKANYRGDSGETEAAYDEWKDTGAGVKLPYKIKISQGGKPAADVVVSEYKLNSGLKAEDLAQKP